jgi:hypothetical protein
MGHAHSHEDQNYYLDQLCTIGISGALGGVAVMMWRQDMLTYILKPPFHWPVLVAGICLLILAAVRGVALWISVGKGGKTHDHDHGTDSDHDHKHAHDDHEHGAACDHDHDHHHEHGAACDHDHDHEHGAACDHDHHHHHEHGPGCTHDHEHAHGAHDHSHEPDEEEDHGHSHGWQPIRYTVLLIPVAFFLLNMPNRGPTPRKTNEELQDTGWVKVEGKGDGPVEVGFTELSQAAYIPDRREDLEGKRVILRGQFVSGPTPNVCTLARYKVTCCSADAVQLNVAIVSPDSLQQYQDNQWVEVEGLVQFRKLKNRDEYRPVLQLASLAGIRPIAAETNPYLP